MFFIKNKINKFEIIIIFSVLLIAVVAMLCLYFFVPHGNYAIVTYTLTDKPQKIYLSEDKTYSLTENVNLPVTLQVKDGAIRFINSECHDHICENFGWISHDGEYAICMPAGVSVTVHIES